MDGDEGVGMYDRERVRWRWDEGEEIYCIDTPFIEGLAWPTTINAPICSTRRARMPSLSLLLHLRQPRNLLTIILNAYATWITPGPSSPKDEMVPRLSPVSHFLVRAVREGEGAR